jgi:hypothetical protein
MSDADQKGPRPSGFRRALPGGVGSFFDEPDKPFVRPGQDPVLDAAMAALREGAERGADPLFRKVERTQREMSEEERGHAAYVPPTTVPPGVHRTLEMARVVVNTPEEPSDGGVQMGERYFPPARPLKSPGQLAPITPQKELVGPRALAGTMRIVPAVPRSVPPTEAAVEPRELRGRAGLVLALGVFGLAAFVVLLLATGGDGPNDVVMAAAPIAVGVASEAPRPTALPMTAPQSSASADDLTAPPTVGSTTPTAPPPRPVAVRPPPPRPTIPGPTPPSSAGEVMYTVPKF